MQGHVIVDVSGTGLRAHRTVEMQTYFQFIAGSENTVLPATTQRRGGDVS